MRAVVVLPLVPVIAAIGMRDGVPGGNSMSITGPATSRGVPSRGRDVHAEAGRGVDLADAAADLACSSRVMSGERKSTPPTSRPIARDRAHGHVAVVGMDDVGDVDRGAAGREVARSSAGRRSRRPCGTESAVVARARQHQLGLRVELEPGQHLLVADAAARVLVHARRPARRWCCLPSPTTWPGMRSVAAISSPLTTSRRWSSPSRKVSTMTERECSRAASKPSRDLVVVGQVDRDAAAVVAVVAA